jgi:protocatechuate 3,4-dioxygenase beta subunit
MRPSSRRALAVGVTLLIVLSIIIASIGGHPPDPAGTTDAERTAAPDAEVAAAAPHATDGTGADRPSLSPTVLCVTGTVEGVDGTLLPGAIVRVLREAEWTEPHPTAVETRADAGGHYVLGPILKPQVTLEASAPGWATQHRIALRGTRCDIVLGRPGRLTGRVLLSSTGKPCPEAEILLEGMHSTFRALTDDDGRYVLDAIAPGSYWFEVIPVGHPCLNLADFRIRAGDIRVVDLLVDEGVRVAGRVVDARTEQPVPDAEVLGSPSGQPVMTGGDGRFEVRVASQGSRGVIVRARGYGTQRAPINLDFDAAEPRLLVKLRPYGRVTGTVTDAQGRPVEGARVGIEPTSTMRDQRGCVTTDESGDFVLEDLAPGKKLRVFAWAPDHGFGSCDVLEDLASELLVTGVMIRLAPAGSLSGTVVDSERQPVAGAWIRLSPATDGLPSPEAPPTDRSGRFEVRGIPTGSYVIHTTAEGFVSRSDDPVQIGEDGAAGTVTIVLERGLVIEGRVLDTAKEPLSDVMIHAHLLNPGARTHFSTRTHTDARGAFRLTGLPPGTYNINTYSPGYFQQNRGDVDTGTEDLVITMPEFPRLVGRVRSLDPSRPLGVFTVITRAGRGSRSAMFSDAEGRFEFPIKPGNHLVMATASGGRVSAQPVPATVPENGSSSPIEIFLESAPGIRGTVRTPEGVPAGHCLITVLPEGTRGPIIHRATRTDAEGAYTVTGLTPGRCIVRASGERWVPTYQSVVLIAGARMTVDLVLGRATGTLRLRVSDPEGSPIRGAVLGYRSAAGHGLGSGHRATARKVWEHLRRGNPSLTWPAYWLTLSHTGDDGEVENPALPPGRYRIAIRAKGYLGGEVEVTIEENSAVATAVTLVRR